MFDGLCQKVKRIFEPIFMNMAIERHHRTLKKARLSESKILTEKKDLILDEFIPDKDWDQREQYLAYRRYKAVFDNPSYYNQATGDIYWPKNDGFVKEPKEIVLPPGTLIDRYGSIQGSFAAPIGTPYNKRSVAPDTCFEPYSIFRVERPLEVKAGKSAAWFDESGGGTQYLLSEKIKERLKDGTITRLY